MSEKYLVSLQDLHDWYFHSLPFFEHEKFNKWMEDHEFHEKTCHAVKFEDDEFGEECTYTCSECGELLVKFDFESKPPYKPTGYCPNCGARVTNDASF